MAKRKRKKRSSPENSPGRVRTFWHPMLVRVLDTVLHEAYEIREEVLVGKMPLRLDIVLIRRRRGSLPESAARELAALVPRLNQFTLVEFKGPTDSLRRGNLDTLIGCAHLYRAQERRAIGHQEMSLIVLAPRITKAFQEDLGRSGYTIHEEETGIHRVVGPTFTTWTVETDRVAGIAEPYLSLFSRVGLRNEGGIIGQIVAGGHTQAVEYVLEQINQRAPFENAIMPLKDKELLGVSSEEFERELIRAASLERRLEGLSAADLLKALSQKGLSKKDLKKLRQLLDRNERESSK